MENPPFVDVFPIGKGGFPASYVSLPEGIQKKPLDPRYTRKPQQPRYLPVLQDVPGESPGDTQVNVDLCRIQVRSCTSFHTVDGSEIRLLPVEVGSLPHELYFFLHPRWLFGISEPSTVWIIGVIGVFHMESKRKRVGGPKQNLTPMMQEGFMRRKWVERRMLRGLLNSKCQYVYCSVYVLVCFLVSWLFCLLVCFCVYIRACMTAERASLQR